MTDIGRMVRSANPVPDDSRTLTDDEFSAVLLLAQRRSGDMDTKQAPPVVAPEKKSRTGWLVAAAAFALVIVVIGASLLFTQESATPPATTPPTTPPTTAAVTPTTDAAPPTTVAEDAVDLPTGPSEQARREAVDSILAALSAGDVESLAPQLGDADLNVAFGRGTQLVDPQGTIDGIMVSLRIENAMGTRFEASDCVTEELPSTIDCTVVAIEPVRESLGLDPLDLDLKARFDDAGNLELLTLRWTLSSLVHTDDRDWAAEIAPFTDWLEETHPGDRDVMIQSSWTGLVPSMRDESVALWAVRVPEYLATVGTGD
jgi:hypothetical protein